MMDNYFSVDISELKNIIETSEVLLIRFPIIDKRLLLDGRYDSEEGPLLKVVPRASSAAERFRHLKEMRPRFPVPKNIVSFTWPKYISSLETYGIWQSIVDRCAKAGYFPLEDLGAVFEELITAERREILSAITGEGYQTIWERTS